GAYTAPDAFDRLARVCASTPKDAGRIRADLIENRADGLTSIEIGIDLSRRIALRNRKIAPVATAPCRGPGSGRLLQPRSPRSSKDRRRAGSRTGPAGEAWPAGRSRTTPWSTP